MKVEENPPRFLHDPELGGAFEELADEHASTERVDRVGRALGVAVATGAITSASSASALFVAAGLVLAGAAGAGVWYGMSSAERGPVEPAVETAAVETRTERAHRPETPVAMPDPPASEVPEEAEVTAPAADPEPARDPVAESARRTPPPSDLEGDLRAYRAAQQALQQGHARRALGLLRELEAAHPETPLQPEIALTRFEALAHAGRVRQALRLGRRLLADPRQRGQRLGIRRLLADLWLRDGRCDQATPHLRWVSSHGSGADRSAALESLARCRELH